MSPTRSVQSYFDGVAGCWSENYAPGGAMHARVERFIVAGAEDAPPDARVLDFGCGSGELARAMAKRGWRVTGCDISREMLRIAEAAPGGGSVAWHAIEPAAKLPFDAASFDLATASSVFEYISDPAASLKELHRTLLPGGRVLLTVPDMRHTVRIAEEKNRYHRGRHLLRWVRSVVTRGEDADYLPYSLSRPTPEGWLDLLRASGFAPCPPAACTDPLLLLKGVKSDERS